MKTVLLYLSLLAVGPAFAVPIMNENVANNGIITIYPDSIDANRFYVAPNVVMIARDDKGVPYFAYNEWDRAFSRVGLMQMTLMPSYTRAELEEAKKGILKKNPNAQFSGLPFVQSNLVFSAKLRELIGSHECNHIAGLIGQEQSCQMLLRSKGRKLFYKALENRSLFTTLQFEYQVDGVARGADGGFVPTRITHGIAARIDGGQFADHPELIQILP